MSDSKKIRRGPIIAVVDRRHSEPIPDEFLPLFEQAGLIVDDGDHHVTVYRDGPDHSFVWGPTVDGAWCARHGDTDGVRVEDRDAGLRWVLDTLPEASPDALSLAAGEGREVGRLYRANDPAVTDAFNAGVKAAADAIEAHAESIGWYEASGVWADAIEKARGAAVTR